MSIMPNEPIKTQIRSKLDFLARLVLAWGVQRFLRARSEARPFPPEHQLGVIETLEVFDVGDPVLRAPQMRALVPQEELASFAIWTRDKGLTDLAIQMLAGDKSYEDLIRDGVLAKARLLIADFQRGEPMYAYNLEVTVADLHCPKPAGCSAEYKIEESISLSITASGPGGGAGLTQSLTFQEAFKTEGACIRIVAPLELEVTPWRNATTTRYLVRVRKLSGPLQAVSQGNHSCGAHFHTYAPKVRASLNQRATSSPIEFSMTSIPAVSRSYSMKSNRTFEFENGLGLSSFASGSVPASAPAPTVPADLSVKVKSVFSRQVEISLNLKGGHDYMCWGSNRRFWWWT